METHRMKSILRFKTKGVLLALVAMFAMSAVAATSASAAKPEFIFTGSKLFTGKVSDTKFVSARGMEECTQNSSSTGEIEGANGSKKVTKVVMRFTGCKSPLGACKSAGANSGEIVTHELEGTLGYLPVKTTEKVGLDLWAKGRTAIEREKGEFHQPFAEFECGGQGAKVRGSLIGVITPTKVKVGPGQAATYFKLTYEQVAGIQNYCKMVVEGKEVTDCLEANWGVEYGPAAEEAYFELFPEGVVEINA
jgi:hypothetical protein